MSLPNLKPGDIPKPMSRDERRRLTAQETQRRGKYYGLAANLMEAEATRLLHGHRCPYCGEVKPGRFRRPQEHPHASGHGWDKGRQQVMWICHDCDQAQGTAPEVRDVSR